MATLHEQYRPSVWDDVAGQPEAVRTIRTVMARSWGGRAYWISGPSGTGKTTLARLIAKEGADSLFTEELEARDLSITKLRELQADWRYRAMSSKPGKALICNESHGLGAPVIRSLLVVLDPLPAHVAVIFTTTATGQARLFEDDRDGDCAPLLSRCTEVETVASLEPLARRAQTIARAEGVDGLPLDVYTAVLSGLNGNLRALLDRIESGKFRHNALEALVSMRQGARAAKGADGERRRQELDGLIAKLKSQI